MVWNTFGQAALSGVMWGLNRYDRPAWTTGFLVAVACLIAMAGGIMQATEGSHIKAVEGVKVKDRDLEKLRNDKELGIPHYNNIKDKKAKPKDKVEMQEAKVTAKTSTTTNESR